ncbi:MAG TPA: hypothetical protein VFN91_00325 [Myxococcaceae bacterium]|nr:hypothetical protein [Myxococcaceae bacterium]
MREAILRKARKSAEVKLRFIEEHAGVLESCARAMAEKFQAGGRLWTLRNGWSIHRTQESHTLLLHLLWDRIPVALGEDDVL